MASGSSRKRIAEDIFKVSPRTFRRYLSTDHPRTKALKRAVEEGELLKGEPLATLICMLIDQRNQCLLRAQAVELTDRLKKAVSDNDELKQYLKRDKRKQGDHFSVEVEQIQLNEITYDLGVNPFRKDDYLYKDDI